MKTARQVAESNVTLHCAMLKKVAATVENLSRSRSYFLQWLLQRFLPLLGNIAPFGPPQWDS